MAETESRPDEGDETLGRTGIDDLPDRTLVDEVLGLLRRSHSDQDNVVELARLLGIDTDSLEGEAAVRRGQEVIDNAYLAEARRVLTDPDLLSLFDWAAANEEGALGELAEEIKDPVKRSGFNLATCTIAAVLAGRDETSTFDPTIDPGEVVRALRGDTSPISDPTKLIGGVALSGADIVADQPEDS